MTVLPFRRFLRSGCRLEDRGASVAAVVVAASWLAVSALTATGQDPPIAPADVADDNAFAARLTDLADAFRQAGQSRQADALADHVVLRRGDRLEVFLPPTDQGPLGLPTTASATRGDGDGPPEQASALALARARADSLIVRAKSDAEAGRAGEALRRLYEAVWTDPDHPEAREMLGFRPSVRGGWTRGERDVRTEARRARHGKYGWAAGTHHRVESAHFRVDTNAPTEQAIRLVARLEDALDLWRQTFPWRWDPRNEVARAIAAGRPVPFPRKLHEVVLFADRREYLAQLARDVPGVEQSTAIYSDVRRTTFLAAGDESPQAVATIYHEACHQFFQELGESAPAIGRRFNVWPIEGVAIYFESLRPERAYHTVGGFDAPRIQVARYRRYLLQQWIPPTDLVRLGLNDFRVSDELPLIYAQSGGLTQLMLAPVTKSVVTDRFTAYVNAVYAGRDRETSWQTLGLDDETVLSGYDRSLLVTDADLADLSLARRSVPELVLARSKVTDDGLARIPEASGLVWLDLSHAGVDGSGLTRLPELTTLRRLSLEGTAVTDRTLAEILDRCPNLVELDLSGTAITDAGLAAVGRRTTLTTVWLTGTRVTGSGLASLRPLRDLTYLDVRDTGVTTRDWDAARPSWPKLTMPTP